MNKSLTEEPNVVCVGQRDLVAQSVMIAGFNDIGKSQRRAHEAVEKAVIGPGIYAEHLILRKYREDVHH